MYVPFAGMHWTGHALVPRNQPIDRFADVHHFPPAHDPEPTSYTSNPPAPDSDAPSCGWCDTPSPYGDWCSDTCFENWQRRFHDIPPNRMHQ